MGNLQSVDFPRSVELEFTHKYRNVGARRGQSPPSFPVIWKIIERPGHYKHGPKEDDGGSDLLLRVVMSIILCPKARRIICSPIYWSRTVGE